MFCSTGNSQHEKQTSSCGQEGYFVNRGDLVVEGWGHIDQSGSYSPLWAKPEVNTTTSFCQLSSSFTSLFNILAFTFNSSTFFRSAVAQAFLSYLSYLYPVVTANQSQFTSSVTGFLCFKDTVDLNSTISVQTLLWVNMCSRNWLNSMTSKQESRWGENTRPKHYHPNKSNDITSLKTSFSTDMDDTE